VATGSQKKGCLWAMNPNKITKMDEEIAKWSKKDPIGIKKGMLMPGKLI
jgi:forkhead box protein N